MVETIPGLTYGFAAGRFVLGGGDTTADADNLPDAVPATGTITFTSAGDGKVAVSPTTLVIQKPVVCTLDPQGWLLDPAGRRGVWLMTGVWNVRAAFGDGYIISSQLQLTTAHKEATPFNLPLHLDSAVPITSTQVMPDWVLQVLAAIEANEGTGAPAEHTHPVDDLDLVQAFMQTFLLSSTAAAARTALGAGTSSLAIGTTSTTAAAGNHGHAISGVTGLQTALDAKATPQNITDAIATLRTQLVDGSPAALDTLNEIAAALQDNPNAIAELLTAVGNRLRFDIAQSLTTVQKAQLAANGGLATAGHVHTAAEVGAATSAHTHTPASIGAATAAQGAKADTAVQPAAIGLMVTSPNDTVRTIERHTSQGAIATPYVLKRVYLVPDGA